MKDGGPAFPVPSPCYDHGEMGELYGMTLRDYFAAKALAALVTDRDALRKLNGEPDYPLERNLADSCYALADAMLAARESKP